MTLRFGLVAVAAAFIGLAAFVAPAESPFASETIHIGVVVSDLEASLEFYTEAVGMQHTTSFDIDADLGTRTGLSDGVPFTIEVLQLGTSDDATRWKLMSFGDRAATQENAFIHDRVGMQYITVYVSDLSESIARLEANGIPLLGDTPTQIPDGRHFVLVQDPDDNFVELIGPIQ